MTEKKNVFAEKKIESEKHHDSSNSSTSTVWPW